MDQNSQKPKWAIIQVTTLEPGKYLATISGGWWAALGPTRKEAVNRVIKRYQAEKEKYDGRV